MPQPTDDEQFVTCPECKIAQADMGRNMTCENCGHGPMPYHDADGDLVEDC